VTFTPDRFSCAGRLRGCARCGGEFVLEGSSDPARLCPDCRPEQLDQVPDALEAMQADPEHRLRAARTGGGLSW
jgi:hypothetical protein